MYSNGDRGQALRQPDVQEERRDERNGITEATEHSGDVLTGDKEQLKTESKWEKLKIGSRAEQDVQSPGSIDERDHVPRNGFFSPQDDPHEIPQTPKSTTSAEEQVDVAGHPILAEKGQVGYHASPPQSPNAPSDVLHEASNGVHARPMERTITSMSNTSDISRRSSALSSMVFVATALETIAASKEARKRKGLGDSVQSALNAIKLDASPNPEIIFEPLRLATETPSIPLTTTALDCIGKLITYSYFSMPVLPEEPSAVSQQPQVPLIERAIDTICDCFQDEATPAEVQLQIVKSLLAAVLNDKIIVHGAGLLKAVRQIYNIFLLSKSSANQQVAQGTLTQMVGTVFERVKTRLAMKDTRMNISKPASERDTANGSQADLNGTISISDSAEVLENAADGDGSSVGNSTFTSDLTVSKEPGEQLTLQSFENVKNFDDTRIGDNAPTMVTRVKATSKIQRTSSGQQTYEEHTDHESDEDDEDEIYVKDAFLVFRSMCRLSTKTLTPEQLQDVKSRDMRSKLISLAIIRTLLNNNMDVFTSPLVTIRSSVNNEPTSFGQAINQYLRLSVSRNGASSVRQVFETSCEIFWLMLKDMRVMLKKEIEVFLKEIYLTILERRNAPSFQKIYIMKILRRLSSDPKALVELYLNYDCDRSALDNMFQRTIEQLSKISSSSILVSPQQQQIYQEQHGRDMELDVDWRDHGKLPPSLTTVGLTSHAFQDSELPVDFVLKQQSLECLVRTLRSLVDWAQETLVVSATKVDNSDSKSSIDGLRNSLDPGHGGVSPRPSAADTPVTPTTPLLDDDPSQFEKAKLRKTALINGIRQFNFKPKRGIKALIHDGFIPSDSPEDIAAFIVQNDQLDKAMIGEYLGEGEPQNVAIMHAFVDSMDFAKRRFVDALRQFLQSFRLPGEAQKIDRFMLKFAERYITGNPNAFANADTAYVLAYSVIMLNTDQHSSKLRGARMTKEDFIKNNRGINDSADLPDEYLVSIYEEIGQNEIVLNTEREHAAALGITVQASSGGIASRAGQVLFTRDLEKEAAQQADQEMSSKAEQRLRSLIRSQRKMAIKPGTFRYIPATSFKHVGPMFDVTWMSFLSGFSAQMQTTQNLDTIKTCMEGLKLAIRIACLFDLETPRVAFVTALANFTNLGNLRDMMAKNLEALKALLEVALLEGNMLKSSWSDILTCISQLDRFQLISGGVDEEVVPDVRKASIVHPKSSPAAGRRTGQGAKRPRPQSSTSSSNYQFDVALESRSTDMIKSVDRIFTSTAELSGDAIIHFVRALSEVSWQEIQSSGQSDSPRTYSLQKLVEISYYNMTRVRFEWTNIWQVLGEHFNQVGCHSNTNVVYFALDSLRQLSMRFMEIEELPGFKFQKDFLKPFEHVMANSSTVAVKDMVLRCLIQMIQARGDNIRSGWKTMFGVFTVAAREPYETLVNVAFEQVIQIYTTRFGVVISQGAFADLVVCLTEFSKNLKFQKKSLQAIETLKSTVPRMLKTPECPLSHRADVLGHNGTHENAIVPRTASRQTQEEQFWFPVLFAFHDVLMTGDDLEVRSQALNYLFDTLIRYGGDFPPEFWDILWRQLLYPIFMVLKSKSEMTKVLNHEDLSVWLSTTMIQALRNMITLFTHYFESLEYMLDRFLDLLALCICQENDTIARIGSNCLQTLILQNVVKFQLEHWHQIVSAFVELFDRTTAYQLFTAATSSSSSSYISDDDGGRRPSTIELEGLPLSENTVDERPLSSSGSIKPNGVKTRVESRDQSQRATSVNRNSSPQPPNHSSEASELEDYRPQAGPQEQPVVVTAARRRFFNKIITRCVLQLLMIETVSELFSNNDVYTQIPSPELLRLMALLKKSYSFAKKFNSDKDLRMRLWREGFMKQPPNLLKQESGSAATYVSILVRMYFDEGEERRRNRAETEAALIPLCADIIHSYVILDEETQHRNIVAWRPVVVDVMEGYTNFPRHDFEKHIETFYPLAVELLNRDLGVEIRLALQSLLRRIGEIRMGMAAVPTPVQTPTSPRSLSSTYFGRRASRVGSR
ncbi:guanine nucleotide exchange protein for ADP-robosylation factor [Xylographa parallela]|nr:guanine nucleotide exchange protein for ADP-robosylation factor [Xylographa parallela]